nr:hypothetical protein GCM10025699_62820 [Microbacterium flavescens]
MQRTADGCGEPFEAELRQGVEEGLPIHEVAPRSPVTDAGPTSEVAEGEPGHARFPNDGGRLVEQHRPQVPVVEGSFRHPAILDRV